MSPSNIEEWAERVRRTCQADNVALVGDEHLWFYRVVRIEYPPDPTGNITRLLATIRADSQNASVIETTG